MNPEEGYKIGFEKGVGKEGNAPYLLYDMIPLDTAFFLLSIPPIISIWGEIKLSFNLYFILLWFLCSFSFILLILMSFQLLLRNRFRNPYTSHELEEIISSVNRRMGFSKHVELWLLHSSKQVLLPLSGLMFRSIVISKQAEADLLASPENAEVVLADNLKALEGRPVASTLFPMAIFILGSFFLISWVGLAELQVNLFPPIFWAIYWVIVIWVGARLAFSDVGRAENAIAIEYSTHPDVARCHVFRKAPPTEDELKSILKVQHNPFSTTDNRLAGLFSYLSAILISAGVGFVLMHEVSVVLLEPIQFGSPLLVFLPVSVSVTLAVFVGVFHYFTKWLYVEGDSK